MPSLGFSISASALSSLANGIAASLAGGDPPLFELRPGPFVQNEFVVLEFHGQEGISKLFQFEVVVASQVETIIDLAHLAESAFGALGSAVGLGSVGQTLGSIAGRVAGSLVNDAESTALEMLLLGQPATLAIHSPHAPPRIVQGICTDIERLGPLGGESSNWLGYRLVLRPRLHLATLRKNSRIFQDVTVRDIVNTILGEHRVPVRWSVGSLFPVRAYTVQHQESDYDFVKRLLAELGLFYYFDPPQGLAAGLIGGAVLGGVAQAASAFGGALGQLADVAGFTEHIIIAESAFSYTPIEDVLGAAPWQTALGLASEALSGAAGMAGGQASGGFSVDANGIHLEGSIGGALGSNVAAAAGALARLAAPSPVVTFQELAGQLATQDFAFQFTLERSLRPKRVTLRDFDYNHPSLRLEAHAKADPSLTGAVSGFGNGERLLALNTDLASPALIPTQELEVYDHHDEYQETDVNRDHTRIQLEQYRRDTRVADGQSVCQRLVPGHRFVLEDHPLLICNKEFAVTHVEHSGHVPEWQPAYRSTSPEQGPVQALNYRNRFECVPAGIAYRMPRPPRKLFQVTETATVVGAGNSEIHTDNQGRIRVHFHWDRGGTRNGESSCWLRVVQPWSGAGWGHQFIPRVGMEVLVSFLGGDPDKPVVVGSLPNALHPMPFPLPSATRSGIRTQSIPGKEGYNELSFEDARNNEQILLRAQRDYAAEILRNSTTRIGVQQSESVGGDKLGTVNGHFKQSIGEDRSVAIKKNDELRIKGDCTQEIHGSLRTAVAKEAYLRANESIRELDRARDEIGGCCDLNVYDDLTTRVRGCWTTVVGSPDEQRSAAIHVEGRTDVYSVDQLELTSEKRLVLRCGETTLTLTPKGIELAGPKLTLRAEDVTLTSAGGAKMALGKEATLAASKINLKSNKPAPGEETQDTELELVDQKGNPAALQRFVVTLSDGTEISGVTDKEGKAVLHQLPADGKLVFPDLPNVEGG